MTEPGIEKCARCIHLDHVALADGVVEIWCDLPHPDECRFVDRHTDILFIFGTDTDPLEVKEDE